jgi:glycosyltransferase involved in cell wall biosynthesis
MTPKVLHVANIDLGILVHLRSQLLFLRSQGYDVHAVCPPGRLIVRDGPSPDGIPVKVIGYTSSAATPVRDLRAFVQLVRHLRRHRFDVVHTHGLKPGLLGRAAARLAGVPVVLHTIHGLFMYDGMPAWNRRLWTHVERLGMRLGDHALSQNQDDVDTALRLGLCRPASIEYLGNGIDVSVFDASATDPGTVDALRRDLGVTPRERVVCIAGRLLREKGYLEFFDAARRIRGDRPDVHFWAVGAEQRDRPGALSSEHAEGADIVRFLGVRADMPRVLAAADVFVLPSHGREGVPRVLMEAAAMGRPIVTTDVRGCRDVIRHEVTGLLVRPYDGRSLAAAIVRLLDDAETAAALGARAAETARCQFDERIYLRRLGDCYARLLDPVTARPVAVRAA